MSASARGRVWKCGVAGNSRVDIVVRTEKLREMDRDDYLFIYLGFG